MLPAYWLYHFVYCILIYHDIPYNLICALDKVLRWGRSSIQYGIYIPTPRKDSEQIHLAATDYNHFKVKLLPSGLFFSEFLWFFSGKWPIEMIYQDDLPWFTMICHDMPIRTFDEVFEFTKRDQQQVGDMSEISNSFNLESIYGTSAAPVSVLLDALWTGQSPFWLANR